METIGGRQKGTFIYVCDGYTYNIDKRINNTYRCSSRRSTGCPGVAKIINEQVHVQTLHQHPPDTKKLEKSKMQNEMLRLSRESLLPLKEIFDNVCRTNLEVAAHISYNSMKSVMARERAKQRPPIPHTFQALSTDLNKYDWIKDFYKGSVTAQDGSMAAIFSSDVLIDALKTTTEMFVDGTFSIVPRIPRMIQLYTVHIRYKNTGIAVVFVLCETQTFALYQAIWEKIIEIAPDLKKNVKFIMGDYERATNNALYKCFPEASLKGCWFHYNQAVLRKWRQLDLTNAPRKLIMIVMSVPLISATLFEQCFTILQDVADTMSSDYPTVLQFMCYLRKTWLPAANKVSVYGCPVRTNNIVESFHNTISKKFGSRHPNVWIFIENLKKVIIDQEIDFRRLQNNLQARRPQTRANKKKK
ncbi:uncharacterized protein LOC120358649 isoform X1 [Solenopsis invicta]|uniref:uncharacterized protein LOC120358649 isoform X1 n=1 Tax=Solenopsis invicta TaxID=13686 RepID=UPI00193CC72E|nr:uncharacterized protein LOC120358649 isoform X1 [Solenopsis invicta]XP_039309457.1 uncharacterized protein LOC120358649 isoform X1 [Solenopsis invicta]